MIPWLYVKLRLSPSSYPCIFLDSNEPSPRHFSLIHLPIVRNAGRRSVRADRTRHMMNIDALLNALPCHSPLLPRFVQHVKLKTWSGRPSPVYNGFSGEERLHLWQLIVWLEAQQVIGPPVCCEICGSTTRAQRHSENYYNPFQAAIVCNRCHLAIHNRFRCWRAWQSLCAQYDPRGVKWFSLLVDAPQDVAGYLRKKYGSEVGNLKRSPLFTVPEAVRSMLQELQFQREPP